MLNKEREERKKRSISIDLTVEKEGKEADGEEFSKQVMFLYDDAELLKRKKE